GVADQRDDGWALATTLASARAPGAHLVELPPYLRQLLPHLAAVQLDLRLARPAPAADPALLSLQVLPGTGEAGQQVFEPRCLHLEVRLAGVGALGEDGQDQVGTVHHRPPQRLLERALLRGAERVVADRQRRGPRLGQRCQLCELAAADERGR